MTNKIISSIILVAAFPIMAITPTNSDSLLFIFISNNRFIATARLALALALAAISFGLISFNRIAKKTFLYVGLGLIVGGMITGLASSLGSFLYDYLKLLDVLIILEAGIILCSIALLPVRKPSRRVSASHSKKSTKPRVALRQPKWFSREVLAHTSRPD
jgi:hypothetical protein